MTRAPKPNTNWQRAAKECLVVALERAEVLAREATELKQLESMIKTVGEVVGGALVLKSGASSKKEAANGDDEDGDD